MPGFYFAKNLRLVNEGKLKGVLIMISMRSEHKQINKAQK